MEDKSAKQPWLNESLDALRSYASGLADIVAVYRFGSQTEEEADELSDLDVGLLLYRNLPDMTHLVLSLDAEICSALGRENVDVVVLNDGERRIYQARLDKIRQMPKRA